MKVISIIFIVVFLYACGAKLAVASTESINEADAIRGAAKFPGTTVASLNIGKANYEKHCQTCHALKAPASKTEDKWRAVVPEMVKKANKKAGNMSIAIDSTTEQSILRYVVTMSSAPKK